MTLEIHGHCDARLEAVREAFVQNFEQGLEIGASLCVTHRGENLLDLWAGWRDRDREHPWQSDTIGLVASTTKIAAGLCALIQVDRGHLSLDARVADYWPEFAQGGKEAVTLRHVFTHTAGVPGLKHPVPQRTLDDWDAVIRLIEAEPAWFEPGTRCCYHARHFGYILGELVRRTSGKPIETFFQEEVADKVGADFSIGVRSKSDIGRLAAWVPSGTMEWQSELVAQVFQSYALDPQPPSWTSISRADPSGNGWTNGRGIARLCAVYANRGELDGVRLLSEALVAEAGSLQYEGEEPIMGWIRLGLGVGLHGHELPAPTETTFHWGGAGGSWGLMDPARRISAGYVMNHAIMGEHVTDDRQTRIWDALREVMETFDAD